MKKEKFGLGIWGKQLLTLVVLVTGFGSMTYAKRLSPAEALNLSGTPTARNKVAAKIAMSRMSLAFTQYERDNVEPALYVFNSPSETGGYLVLAADDEVENIVLGYSDTGRFDPNHIPTSMQWLLNAYSDYVGKVRRFPMSIGGKIARIPSRQTAKVSSARRSRQPIKPLLTTSWGQGEPFNGLCPVVDGERSVTGCVATAMAQVMKYHKWPTMGVGEHSYSFSYEGKKYTASANFGTAKYEWGKMLDDYVDGSTASQAQAVSTLMYHCGVAVDMQYSAVNSGAVSFNAGLALLTYFDYDKSMKFLARNWFTEDEWDDIIYEQLNQAQPVLYSGRTLADEGHAFVCDGYDGDGFYHINWGWYGYCDGYFTLANLDPEEQGIGGSSEELAFNFEQTIFCDIKKNEGTAASGLMAMNRELEPLEGRYDRNAGAYVQFSGGFYSYSLSEVNFETGVKLVSDSWTKYIPGEAGTLLPREGYYNLVIPAQQFPEGEYDVYPAFRTEGGEWRAMCFDRTRMNGCVHVLVTSSDITFVLTDEGAAAQHTVGATWSGVSPVKQTGDGYYVGREYDFTYDVQSKASWKGELACLVFDYYYMIWSESELRTMTLSASDKTSASFRVKMEDGMREGTYYVALAYVDGDYYRLCSDIKPFRLEQFPEPKDGWTDVTDELLRNPSMEDGVTGWDSGYFDTYNGSETVAYSAVEFWQTTCTHCQTIPDAPAGRYRLSAQAFYRAGSNNVAFPDYLRGNEQLTAVLYAGKETVPVPSVYDYARAESCVGDMVIAGRHYPNTMQGGAMSFQEGHYPVSVVVEHLGGKLEVGIRNETYLADNWCMMDNFRLEYCKDIEFDVDALVCLTPSVSLLAGDKEWVRVQTQPTNLPATQLSWSSSDPSVATVDNVGIVTAVGVGKCEITVAYGGGALSAKIGVEVLDGTCLVIEDVTAEVIKNSTMTGLSSWESETSGYYMNDYVFRSQYGIVEAWNCAFDFYQVGKDLPAGLYRVACQGFFRPASNTQDVVDGRSPATCHAVLYAGDHQSPLADIASARLSKKTMTGQCVSVVESKADGTQSTFFLPDDIASASSCLRNGYYANSSVLTYWPGGAFRVGIRLEDNARGNWAVWDNICIERCSGGENAIARTAADGQLILYGDGNALCTNMLSEISVYNIGGEKVMAASSVTRLPFASLAPGFYVAQARSNGAVATLKFRK